MNSLVALTEALKIGAPGPSSDFPDHRRPGCKGMCEVERDVRKSGFEPAGKRQTDQNRKVPLNRMEACADHAI